MTVPWGSSLTSVATSLPYGVVQELQVSKLVKSGSNVSSMFSWVFVDCTAEKLYPYISVFDGKLNIISSLKSLQITLELTIVKKDLLHHICPLNKSKGLLKEIATFNITGKKLKPKLLNKKTNKNTTHLGKV